jgi:hypothetical protein
MSFKNLSQGGRWWLTPVILDRDQEDHGSKLTRANNSRDPISKIPNTKRTGGVAQGV